MDITKIMNATKDDLHQRGWTNEEIEKMSPEKAFQEFCEWHGLINWGETLISVLDNLRESK